MSKEKDEIRNIIAKILDIDEKKITDKTNLMEDLFVDSLTFIHIIAEIERKYDIEFSSDMLNVTDKVNVDTIYNKIQELREGTNNEK